MLQSLLADRFGLAVHWEDRQAPVYVLLVGKNGPNLRPGELKTDASLSDPETQTPRSGGGAGVIHLYLRSATLASFADSLGRLLGEPVVNHTGLNGTYDIPFDYSVNLASNYAAALGRELSSDDAISPSVFAALEGLGLKLERQRTMIKVVVIDHMDRAPTPN